MSFVASGANTLAASDDRSLSWTGRNAGETFRGSATYYLSGLAAGSTTFTAKYRTETGTSGHTNAFSNRSIIVLPLP